MFTIFFLTCFLVGFTMFQLRPGMYETFDGLYNKVAIWSSMIGMTGLLCVSIIALFKVGI